MLTITEPIQRRLGESHSPGNIVKDHLRTGLVMAVHTIRSSGRHSGCLSHVRAVGESASRRMRSASCVPMRHSRAVTTRRILAGSGGFIGEPGRWGVMRPGGIMQRALALTGKDRPAVCLVMTASGDEAAYLAATYSALGSSCQVDHLALFPQPNRPVEEVLGRADLVWVGGGSVANLLALWRLHGVDEAMRDAWERGVILGGVSAGSICWHVGGPTDSFGPELKPVTNALAFLPFGTGVHYDSEAGRRPLLQNLVGEGVLPESLATDDAIAILYEGTEPIEVVADRPDANSCAYRVIRNPDGRGVTESVLPVGRITT